MTDDSCGRSNHIVCEGKNERQSACHFLIEERLLRVSFFLMLCIHRQYFQTT